MTVMGVDYGEPGGDRSVVHTSHAHGWRVGETWRVPEWPRRQCAIVKEILSDRAFEFKIHTRPSKGYRRHIRRMKATK